jgi:hypothetical protein
MQMKSGQIYFFTSALLFFVFVGSMLAQTNDVNSAPIKDLRAAPSVGIIKISWKSESESGVDHYELHRSNSNSGTFNCIRDNISRLGDYQTYNIDDNCDLFKTEGTLFQYKVRVVMSDGSFKDSNIISTYYSSTSSTAKRTWGSIKAMFR